MSNGRIDEMMGPQQQLSAFLIIIHLQKFIASFFGNLFISTEVSLKESYTWHSGNSPDCQMVLRTDHFVDGAFRGSNWNPTEQLAKVF